MNSKALRSIKLSKGQRILAGQDVTIYRAISTVDTVKLYEITIGSTSFTTTESIRTRFFS